jgi:hypothetical protein
MATEFKLICHSLYSTENFINEIKKSLSDGWELRGDLNCNGKLCQLLIKNNVTNSFKVIDYIIVGAPGLHDSDSYRPSGIERIPNFNKKVNKYLSDNWELYGNIIFGVKRECWSADIYQVLVKYAPVENNIHDLLELNKS